MANETQKKSIESFLLRISHVFDFQTPALAEKQLDNETKAVLFEIRTDEMVGLVWVGVRGSIRTETGKSIRKARITDVFKSLN